MDKFTGRVSDLCVRPFDNKSCRSEVGLTKANNGSDCFLCLERL